MPLSGDSADDVKCSLRCVLGEALRFLSRRGTSASAKPLSRRLSSPRAITSLGKRASSLNKIYRPDAQRRMRNPISSRQRPRANLGSAFEMQMRRQAIILKTTPIALIDFRSDYQERRKRLLTLMQNRR